MDAHHMDHPPTSAGEGRALRDALIGALLGDLVHRLNNPLTLLSANLEFLAEHPPGGGGADGPEGEEAQVIEECRVAVSELVDLTATLGAWERASEAENTVDAHAMWALPVAIASLAGRYHGELILAPSAGEGAPLVTCPAVLNRALLALLLVALERPVAYGILRLTVVVTSTEIRFGVEDSRPSSPPAEGLQRPWPEPPASLVRQAVALLQGRWEQADPGVVPRDVLVIPRR